jgi:cytochrome b pre-mRNA-processing protein 3
LSFLSNIFGKAPDRERLAPLYAAVVAAARSPVWYREGQVPDTIDGRFDMVAAILALVLLRLEAEGERARGETVLLTERFIDDMEGNIRQLGTGDVVVGKRIGKMMSALGGRLDAFRSAVDAGADFSGVAARNVFHEKPPAGAAEFVGSRLKGFFDRLQTIPGEEIVAGRVPAA